MMAFASVTAQVLLTVVFTVSAAGKLRAPSIFRESLRSLRLVPRPLVGTVIWLVIVVEVALAIALAVVPLVGFPAAAVTMTIFTGVVGWSLWRRTAATCRCFGYEGGVMGWPTVLRNTTLLGCALVGVLGRGSPVSLPVEMTVAAALAGACGAAAVIAFDAIVALFARGGDPGGGGLRRA